MSCLIKKIITVLTVISIVITTLICPVTAAQDNFSLADNADTILFEDVFINTDAWDIISGTGVDCLWERLNFSPTKDTKVVVRESKASFDNCEIAFDFSCQKGNSLGVLFRMESIEKHYLLKYSFVQKKLLLLKVNGGGVYTKIAEASIRLPYKKTAKVDISAVNDHICISVNGEKLIDAYDSDIRSGYLGFMGEQADAWIDNVKVYQKASKDYTMIIPEEETVSDKEVVYVYVAPDGADTNKGTKESPVATLSRAKEIVKTLKRGGVPVDVIFREGEYKFNETVNFEYGDSGVKGAPVTYRAAENEQVVFTGAQKLNINAFKKITDAGVKARLDKRVTDKILCADLSELGLPTGIENFDQYYLTAGKWENGQNLKPPTFLLNGSRQTISRWPNSGYELVYDAEKGGARASSTGDVDQGGSIYYIGTRPRRWTQAKDAYIEGFLGTWYHGEWVKVKNIDVDEGKIDLLKWTQYGVLKNHRWSIVNLLEEIDIPGEWYMDKNAKVMYYYPPYKLSEEDVLEVTALQSNFINLNKTEYVNFEGIKFENNTANPNSLEMTAGGGDGISGTNTKNIIIKDCDFRNIGQAAINIDGTNLLIEGCVVNGTGFSGIKLSGGDVENQKPGNNVIRNCDVANVSLSTGNNGYNGIDIAGVDNVVEHCVLHSLKNGAIRYTGTGHLFRYNEIYEAVRETADAGSVYSARSFTYFGTRVINNFFHNIGLSDPEAAYPASSFFADDHLSGQEFTGNISVVENFAKSSTIKTNGGSYNVFKDNIMANSQYGSILADFSNSSNSNFMEINSSRLIGLDYTKSGYMNKYPQTAKILEHAKEDNGYFIPRNTYTGNVSIGVLRGDNIGNVHYRKGVFENNITIPKEETDNIYVDPSKLDYRITEEAREKYNISAGVPGEDNFDINLIGIQEKSELANVNMDFILQYPENKSEGISAQQTSLSWENTGNSDKYEYIVAEDPELKNVVVKGETIFTTVEINNLENGKTYYWTVNAKHTSRDVMKTVQSTSGVYSFSTGLYDDLDKAALGDRLKAAEALLETIVEGDERGDYKLGTREKFENEISNAHKVYKITKGVQKQIDEADKQLNTFMTNIEGHKISGYSALNVGTVENWQATDTTATVSVKNDVATLTTVKDKRANFTITSKLPNTEIQCFDVKVDGLDDNEWFGLNLKQTKNAIMWGDESYYVVIKKDLLELQVQGKILVTAPNDDIFNFGDWHRVEFGAIPTTNGINLIFKVDDKIVFDWLEQDMLFVEEGMFGVFLPQESTAYIREVTDVPEEKFELSQETINSINGIDITYFGTDDEVFMKYGNWDEADGGYENYGKVVGSKKDDYVTIEMAGANDTYYKVSYYNMPSSDNDKNVKVSIAGFGDEDELIVDLTSGEEGFVELGTYYFLGADYIGRLAVTFIASGDGNVPLSCIKIERVFNN